MSFRIVVVHMLNFLSRPYVLFLLFILYVFVVCDLPIVFIDISTSYVFLYSHLQLLHVSLHMFLVGRYGA